MSANISAIASLIAAVAALIGALGTFRVVKQVHKEVKTSNGITLAALADRTEGRRITETIEPADRTEAEAGYVEMLDEGGRNVGHEDD